MPLQPPPSLLLARTCRLDLPRGYVRRLDDADQPFLLEGKSLSCTRRNYVPRSTKRAWPGSAPKREGLAAAERVLLVREDLKVAIGQAMMANAANCSACGALHEQQR
jgi:hypothetical protein